MQIAEIAERAQLALCLDAPAGRRDLGGGAWNFPSISICSGAPVSRRGDSLETAGFQ
jgi:hypothetical protein